MRSPNRPADADFNYWKSTRRMTLWLLLVWFLVTFSAIYFARSLSTYTVFGWPISFFMAAQGSILIYVAIIGIYALRMRRLDRMHRQQQDRAKHEN
jgi:putative solute:sodium symporter small subunit